MLKKLACPNCGNKPMSWMKKLFGFTLKCKSCGVKLSHDFLWSFSTLLIFTSLGYFLIRYFFGVWVTVPILVLASLVIVITPLKHKVVTKLS